MVYSVLTQHYFTRSPAAQIRTYSRKQAVQAIFQRKGKKGQKMLKNEQKRAKSLKIWEKCTKFENILKKGR